MANGLEVRVPFCDQMHSLLAAPDAPLFTLVNRERLASAYARDPGCPARWAFSRVPWRRPRSCSTSTAGCRSPASRSA